MRTPSKIRVVVLLLAVISVGGLSRIASGYDIYNTSFSTDPGWITDQPGNYMWDADTQSYSARVENHWPGYSPSRYFYHQINDTTGGFTLQWDTKLTRVDWSAAVLFGLMDSHLYGGGGAGNGNEVYVVYANPDQGNTIAIYIGGSAGGAEAGSSGGVFALNQWYSNTITYDPALNEVAFVAKNRDTNAIVWSANLSVPGGGFSTDLDRIGGSNSGMAVGGIYNGVSETAIATGYIDNVALTPEPATLSLLALGGLAMVRRRRK